MKQSETKKRIEVVDRANDKMKILTRRYAKAYGEEALLQVSGVYRKIEKEAFLKNSKIQRLDLPKSVLELGIDAFRGCSNLTEVNLPEHLAVIGKGCFAECPRLMKAEIPVYVQWIEEETFYKDRRLQTVNFAKRSHVQKIGMDAFRECGNMESIHLPGGLGVRIDTALYQNYQVSAHYDSMVAKIIVHGENRLEAIRRMRRVLSELVIEGIETNQELLYLIFHNAEYVKGNFNTSFIEKNLDELVK